MFWKINLDLGPYFHMSILGINHNLHSRAIVRLIGVEIAPGHTEKTRIPFPFKLNGIWSWWHFPFDFEPNGSPFCSKSKGKLSPQSYPIQCERNWKYSFLSVDVYFVSQQYSVAIISFIEVLSLQLIYFKIYIIFFHNLIVEWNMFGNSSRNLLWFSVLAFGWNNREMILRLVIRNDIAECSSQLWVVCNIRELILLIIMPRLAINQFGSNRKY